MIFQNVEKIVLKKKTYTFYLTNNLNVGGGCRVMDAAVILFITLHYFLFLLVSLIP